jgi:hypothetical protein
VSRRRRSIWPNVTRSIQIKSMPGRNSFSEQAARAFEAGNCDSLVTGTKPSGHHATSFRLRRCYELHLGLRTSGERRQSDRGTWTALLGSELRKCFNRVWINNAGFDGHTSFAHLQPVRNYIVSLHPKMVVMLIGATTPLALILLRAETI